MACGKDPGVRFILNTYPWKCLIVLELYIITRLVFLDEVVFQQQGIELGVDHDMPDGIDLPDQQGKLGPHGPVLIEVRGHSFAKALGLADIDHLTFFIDELVHTRLVRKCLYGEFELIYVLIIDRHICSYYFGD